MPIGQRNSQNYRTNGDLNRTQGIFDIANNLHVKERTIVNDSINDFNKASIDVYDKKKSKFAP